MSETVIRTMSEDEAEALLDLLESAFGFRKLFERYLSEGLFRSEDTLLATREGRRLACVQLCFKRIALRGETIPIAGIGSVGTAPEARRQGLATRLLEYALERIADSGAALVLLFTGLHGFYGRLGFHPLPQRRWRLRRPRPLPNLPHGSFERDADADDLLRVMELYASYCRGFEASTLRDAAYWSAQLRYAGGPGERFRLVERRGIPVAYARLIEENGYQAVIEFARAPDAAEELAALLCAMAPTDGGLLLPATPDLELEQALALVTPGLAEWMDPSPLWRVVDAEPLRRLEDVPANADDAALLAATVGGPRSVYWPSDRF
ncbi:MAG: GNAT family N-acetyltransferase [Myxococcota bacterium]